jgi:hypothetical protein
LGNLLTICGILITFISSFSHTYDVEYTAYDVKAKKKVKMLEPKIVKMKNGRYAAKGKSPLTGNTVFRILSKEESKKAGK